MKKNRKTGAAGIDVRRGKPRLPRGNLILAARAAAAKVIGRAAGWPVKWLSGPPLQDSVCRKPNGVFDPFGFEELVDQIGEAGAGFAMTASFDPE